ncbi:MAG: response regulator [Ignavibacteria bacterium]|jgi:DNA-binding NtrC family response regulator|nr:response regulator [Ignavibacteria bacterium]MCU7501022.1 response regulator [Ignavibacteria bacterium]MCU7514253.1 response regulator [Ignavibacteria bacterium]MCU7522374.1 response regulator [Ignavibacteria bacterium]MCU7525996.1 response regulator [Ignavibacteria bacterium]
MESILIVDDDINLCSLLREELNEIGYDAYSVNGADETFAFLDSGRMVDLLLLDLKMPEKDGFYVLETLKARKMDVKVIVLTAYADVKSAIDSAKLGASDFISKPYDFDELLITIRKVLQKEKEHED